MQGVLVGAGNHLVAQAEGRRRGGTAIDRIHHLDAVAGGQRPTPQYAGRVRRIADTQLAAAAGRAAIDHQPVRRGAVTFEEGIQADGAIACVAVHRQGLVHATDRRGEVDQAGVVVQAGQPGIAGEVPGAVHQGEVRRAAGLGERRAGQGGAAGGEIQGAIAGDLRQRRPAAQRRPTQACIEGGGVYADTGAQCGVERAVLDGDGAGARVEDGGMQRVGAGALDDD
ncbi:hypothetical protein D3C81_1072130 [compost metagenome]